MPIKAINSGKILLFCAVIEVCYLGLSLNLASLYGQWSIQGEVLRTCLRLVVIACFAFGYRRYFYGFRRIYPRFIKRNFAFYLLITALFVFALLYTNAINETLTWQGIFAISGITAGIREELFYRGMVQNYLAEKSKPLMALAGASALFTLSHVQYLINGQYDGLLFIALAGVSFGCIYLYSRSIVLTCLTHGFYDALLSINISPLRLSHDMALLILAMLTLLLILLIHKQLVTSSTSHVDL